MKLMVFILNHPEKLDDVLAGFVELGISGATVVDSVGMARILADRVPLFAGFSSLLDDSRTRNRIILAVIRSQDRLDEARRMIEDVCGPLERPGAGILFSVPVDDVTGLRDNAP